MLAARAPIFVFVSAAQVLAGCCKRPSDTTIPGSWHALGAPLTRVTFLADHTLQFQQPSGVKDGGEITFLRATGTWHVSNENFEITFQDSSRPDEDTLHVYVGSKVC